MRSMWSFVLIFTVVVFPLAFAGCGGPGATVEPTEVEELQLPGEEATEEATEE